MTKKKIKVLLVILFVTGISILLYPLISQYWNSFVQSKAISDYDKMLLKKQSIDYTKVFQEANNYNQELSKLEFPLLQYKTISNTSSVLNVSDNGMIGYITIEKIGVEIPIYHGTSSSILATFVGHLKGSSLPIGGKSTHSILSAHTGLPSAKLFTNINKLEIGDTFIITVLDRKLTYQVDKIVVVEPNDVSNLNIVDGYDYVTLLTCTPYGLNTHRLLVRGIRMNDVITNEFIVTSDAEKIDKLIVASILSMNILLILMIFVLIKPVKSYEKLVKEVI